MPPPHAGDQVSTAATSRQERLFIVLGVAMAAALVWIASSPFDPGALHLWYRRYPAHFAAFTALAVAWGLGLPRVSSVAVVLAVAAFGFGHEA